MAATGAEAGPTFEPGHRLAHYKIVRLLGRGGQASAYLAEDTRLGRPVVLKTLRGDAGGERARRRLEREACLCSVLDNPNICAIYDLLVTFDGHWLEAHLDDVRRATPERNDALGLSLAAARDPRVPEPPPARAAGSGGARAVAPPRTSSEPRLPAVAPVLDRSW